MPSATTLPFWRKYFTVEIVVFFYFYGFLMYLPIGGIYVYQRVSDMKGFPYQNISQGLGEDGCGGDELNENSTIWDLEREVCNCKKKNIFQQIFALDICGIIDFYYSSDLYVAPRKLPMYGQKPNCYPSYAQNI